MTDQRIFQLEKQLLESLSENRENQSGNEISPLIVAAIEKKSNEEGLFCNSCLVSADDREHFKTDFHRFNTKRRIKGLDPLSEDQFDELEELSSIEASSDDDDDDDEIQKSKAGSPFIPFHVGQTNTELLVYKQVLFNSKAKDEDYLKQLHGIQIGNSKVSWTLIMLSSGHFSAAIVDLRTLKPVVHKTFHRYTTRRKQGGAQSQNDKSKGKANSAGAGIRRYNEQALQEEIQQLIREWKDSIKDSTLIFIRAPATMRNILFFDTDVLNSSDDKIRSFPFITKRPTLKELMRCFDELTLSKIANVASKQTMPTKTNAVGHISVKEAALKKAIDAIKSGKVALFEQCMADHFTVNETLTDSQGISFLHIAAEFSHAEVVNHLLEKGADPTKQGQQRKVCPYDLADSKDCRDTFRRFMAKYPDRWDYFIANIPGPLTAEMEDKAKEKGRERKRKDKERKNAEKIEAAPKLEDLLIEDDQPNNSKSTNLKKSQIESIGISPEMRQKLDREKRALAAEARIRSQKNQCGNCGKSLSGINAFEKSVYKYCSMDCLKSQQIIF